MERIGCFGISQGGTWTWLLAAAGDRVKASAPVVGVGLDVARAVGDRLPGRYSFPMSLSGETMSRSRPR